MDDNRDIVEIKIKIIADICEGVVGRLLVQQHFDEETKKSIENFFEEAKARPADGRLGEIDNALLLIREFVRPWVATQVKGEILWRFNEKAEAEAAE